MINIFNKIITFFTGHSSSFFAGYMTEYISSSTSNMMDWIADRLISLLWSVVSFVMTCMDVLQYIAYSFLGLDMSLKDFAELEEKFNMTVLKDTFRALAGLAILLMLVFTIIAVVKQEYENVSSGFAGDGKGKSSNSKLPFITKILRNTVWIFAMPLIVILLFGGVTSILNSFNQALQTTQGSTIASQLLSTSTYEANKYRMYANSGQRIPIVINAYDSSDANIDNLDDMALIIESMEVQSTLRDIATNIVNKSFSDFSSTMVRKNNTLVNNSEYSKLHEQFICTAEQYHVMADFVDYAQQTGLEYYIKSVDDESIDWKYVSSAVFKQGSNELIIEYTNAAVVNNGFQASAASGNSDETYTITYTPAANTSSPISDTLNSIKALLGIGEYGDNVYNVMDRDESFTNLVTWSNEKAFLKLEGLPSKPFNIEDRSTWSETDEILIYEYYRWQNNNSLRNYSIDDLKNGIEWDVQLISYKEYYDYVGLYSEERYYYCIELNKNYYIVEKNEKLTDKFGNAYYVLKAYKDEDIHFLQGAYSTIEKVNSTVTLTLHNGFSINDFSSWNPQDQILVYEYFNDASYSNNLRQYSFSEFYYGKGVTLDYFKITNYDSVGDTSPDCDYCVLLNKTYYELNISKNGLLAVNNNTKLLTKTEDGKTPIYYDYKLNTSINVSTNPEVINNVYVNNRYGLQLNKMKTTIGTSGGYVQKVTVNEDNPAADSFDDLNLANSNDLKYENFTLKLSSNFKYGDLSTWSYRDVFVFWLYCTFGYGNDISYLKNYGIKGEVGKIGGNYCFKIDSIISTPSASEAVYPYIKVSDIELISTESLYFMDVEQTYVENSFTVTNNDVVISKSDTTDKFINDSSVDTYHFEFSNNFSLLDESTWTIQDFILAYCSKLGLINTIENLKVTGYDALMYKGSGGDIYYRFGKDYNSALYLKQTKLKTYFVGGSGEFTSFEAFLRQSITNLKLYQNNADKQNYLLEKQDGSNHWYASYICVDWLKSKTAAGITSNYVDGAAGTTETLKFSSNFEASNYKTWTQADFLLYYIINLYRVHD